jgi:hypothetical protein
MVDGVMPFGSVVSKMLKAPVTLRTSAAQFPRRTALEREMAILVV